MNRPRSFEEVQTMLNQLEGRLALIETQNIDLHQRRVINAANAVDKNDYITSQEVDDRISAIKFPVTSVSKDKSFNNLSLTAFASAFLSLTTSYADISGATITLPEIGTYIIIGIFDFVQQGSGDIGANLLGQLVVNSVAQTGNATFSDLSTGLTFSRSTVTQCWKYTSAAINLVAKLQAEKSSGTGSSGVNGGASTTSITAILIN